jgi:hypothetical protein
VNDELLLTRAELVEELAKELSISPQRVRLAATALRGRIVTVAGERNGKKVEVYGPKAVAAIKELVLRDKARRAQAGEQGVAYWRALASLRSAGRRLVKLVNDLNGVYDSLRVHPPSVSATIHTLPHPGLALVAPPVMVLVTPLRRSSWRAKWAEAGVEAKGKGQEGAVSALRREIVNTYLALREAPEQDPERWAVLEQLIRERRPRPPRAGHRAAANETEPTERGVADERGEQTSRFAGEERRDA